MLSVKHVHERDRRIVFKEQGHVYSVAGDSRFKSVTQWVKKKFSKFDADSVIDQMMTSPKWPQNKYFLMTKQEIKDEWKANGSKAANDGTYMHKMCEDYYNQKPIDSYSHTLEYNHFLDFLRDHPHLVPFRSEWMVYDEHKRIAGCIDMVFMNPDQTLSIYDWKRCKSMDTTNSWNKYSIDPSYSSIPDTNYGHYSLQLNMYKNILEKNYGYTVSELWLVCMHHELDTTYKKWAVPWIDIV